MRSGSEAVARKKKPRSGSEAVARKKKPRSGSEAIARKRVLTFADVRKMLLAFPGVEEGPCYGTPGFRVAKKFLTRLHQAGDSMVVKVSSIDERDMVLEADPKVFHITEHYRNYPALLVRIAAVEPETLRAMLERNWRLLAPKKLLSSSSEAVGQEKSVLKQRGGTNNKPQKASRTRSSRVRVSPPR